MNLFYAPELAPGVFPLPETEARHAVQVLRLRPGDPIEVVDGKGNWCSGRIAAAGKKGCEVETLELAARPLPYATPVTLAVAPTKNLNRMEWLLEKATEIGLHALIPFTSRHSERRQLRNDRLEKVMIAAMKQSLKAHLPELEPLCDLTDLLEQIRSFPGQKFIAYLGEQPTSTPLFGAGRAGIPTTVLIGPEGGFLQEEVEQAVAAGCVPVSLGANRLRTETAALMALHTCLLWS